MRHKAPLTARGGIFVSLDNQGCWIKNGVNRLPDVGSLFIFPFPSCPGWLLRTVRGALCLKKTYHYLHCERSEPHAFYMAYLLLVVLVLILILAVVRVLVRRWLDED